MVRVDTCGARGPRSNLAMGEMIRGCAPQSGQKLGSGFEELPDPVILSRSMSKDHLK